MFRCCMLLPAVGVGRDVHGETTYVQQLSIKINKANYWYLSSALTILKFKYVWLYLNIKKLLHVLGHHTIFHVDLSRHWLEIDWTYALIWFQIRLIKCHIVNFSVLTCATCDNVLDFDIHIDIFTTGIYNIATACSAYYDICLVVVKPPTNHSSK